jgi:hypothetical protein
VPHTLGRYRSYTRRCAIGQAALTPLLQTAAPPASADEHATSSAGERRALCCLSAAPFAAPLPHSGRLEHERQETGRACARGHLWHDEEREGEVMWGMGAGHSDGLLLRGSLASGAQGTSLETEQLRPRDCSGAQGDGHEPAPQSACCREGGCSSMALADCRPAVSSSPRCKRTASQETRWPRLLPPLLPSSRPVCVWSRLCNTTLLIIHHTSRSGSVNARCLSPSIPRRGVAQHHASLHRRLPARRGLVCLCAAGPR